MTGIICIESEFELTKSMNSLSLNSEPLMRFVSETHGVPYVYRKVATLEELKYYFKQFSKIEFAKKYKILYFSFHGGTQKISLEGENKSLGLDDLAEIGGTVFENRLVHFSSCRTFLGSSSFFENFKNLTGSKFVSGYTKTVDMELSAIHDLAMLGAFASKSLFSSQTYNKLYRLYQGLEEELGFVHF